MRHGSEQDKIMQLDEIVRRILFRLRGRVIHLSPKGKLRGYVLFSYVTLPFFNRNERTLNAHSNRWECLEMTKAFLEKGYAVDLIDITNTTFVPQKKYDFFVDNYHNMERLTPLLDPKCVKIFHATTAHWKYNNDAEEERFNDLYARRRVRLAPDRPLPPNRAIEICDEATLLGNDFTAETYAYANKKITRIPISTTHTYPSPEKKDFAAARKNFIWFGGAGVIHKGLDLAVEAFAKMPELNLTICGKIEGEKDFLRVYEKELMLPNIAIAGFMDPGSEAFTHMCDTSLALVYPSCSEGQAGSVVLTMHAGLIPIISRQSGVSVHDFGTILQKNTVEEIMRSVREISNVPIQTLQERSVAAWTHARAQYTRKTFSETYNTFVDMLIEKYRV